MSSKIIYPDIAQKAEFAYDLNNMYLANTLYLIPTEQKWLLGVLNCSLTFWFYTQLSPQIRGGFVRFIAQYVSQIPIPNASEEQKQTIETLVQKCLEAKGQNCQQWEKEIDQIVYQLYDLTPAEIALIEKSPPY
ncbi:MAG: TaqI-like C-terminal specificity domain-containing protein [Snowella sp.]|nr:TaqI-like C-terminal specificity domain-containing protein [Snowella sp.]